MDVDSSPPIETTDDLPFDVEAEYVPEPHTFRCPNCGEASGLVVVPMERSRSARQRLQAVLRQASGGLSMTQMRTMTGMGEPRIRKALGAHAEFVVSGEGVASDPRRWHILSLEQMRLQRERAGRSSGNVD